MCADAPDVHSGEWKELRWHDDFPPDPLVIVERIAQAANVKRPQSPAKKYVRAAFMLGHVSGNRNPDVLIAWNEPDRRSDGKIGPKIPSCIEGESEDSITAAVPSGNRYD